MRGTRSIGAMAAGALLTALVLGAGAVAGKGQTLGGQSTIVLYSGDDGIQQQFKLRNKDGDKATIGAVRDRLTNAAGLSVGKHHWQCLQSSVAWYCSGVLDLNAAAPSGAGTITVAGLFEGFSGESFAITGGTGAYTGAEGKVVLTVEDGRLVRTVKLIP
jgi:hypothetical protein